MELLRAIPDRRVQKTIAASIDRLTKEPEKQGKPLLGEFLGYRSLRAVGQRYRIITAWIRAGFWSRWSLSVSGKRETDGIFIPLQKNCYVRVS